MESLCPEQVVQLFTYRTDRRCENVFACDPPHSRARTREACRLSREVSRASTVRCALSLPLLAHSLSHEHRVPRKKTTKSPVASLSLQDFCPTPPFFCFCSRVRAMRRLTLDETTRRARRTLAVRRAAAPAPSRRGSKRSPCSRVCLFFLVAVSHTRAPPLLLRMSELRSSSVSFCVQTSDCPAQYALSHSARDEPSVLPPVTTATSTMMDSLADETE